MFCIAAPVQAATHDAVVLVTGDARSESTARYALERIGAAKVRGASPSALRQAAARQVLRQLPRLYTESRFDACAEAVGHVERQLATQLTRESSAELGLLKELNFWNGVCRAGAGAERSATRSFALAARLRGPEPTRELFPPDVLKLYQRAQDAGRRSCALRLPAGLRGIKLDGQAVASGAKVQRGDHYVVWDDDQGLRSDRVQLKSNCRLILPESKPLPLARPPSALPQIEDSQAGDEAFLADVGRADLAPEVLLVGVVGGEARVRLFGVSSGRWLMTTQAAIGPDQAAGEVLRDLIRQVLNTAPPVDKLAVPTQAEHPPEDSKSDPATPNTTTTGAIEPTPPAHAADPGSLDSDPPPATTTTAATTSDDEANLWWIWPAAGGAAVIAVLAVTIPLILFWPKDTTQPDRRYEIVF